MSILAARRLWQSITRLNEDENNETADEETDDDNTADVQWGHSVLNLHHGTVGITSLRGRMVWRAIDVGM